MTIVLVWVLISFLFSLNVCKWILDIRVKESIGSYMTKKEYFLVFFLTYSFIGLVFLIVENLAFLKDLAHLYFT